MEVIYELQVCENRMSQNCTFPDLQVRKGPNWDLLRYISKCRDQGFMVLWIQYEGNSGLISSKKPIWSKFLASLLMVQKVQMIIER